MYLIDNKNRVGSLLILLFSLSYLSEALELPVDLTAGGEFFTSRTLPVGLALASIAFALIQLLLPSAGTPEETITDSVEAFRWRPAVLLVLLMTVYAMSFQFLGFSLASALFLFLGFVVLGERRFLHAALLAVGMVVFLWALLTQVFGLYLDNGRLLAMIGGQT